MVHVLVHGAMCGGWVWDDVAERLKAAGIEVRIVDQLPSGGVEPGRLGDLSDDAGHVRHLLDEIDTSVVLVGHSYGGMVITELADHPAVRHSVYLTAVWPQRGQSVRDLYGGALPEPIMQRADGHLQITDDFDLAWGSFGRGLDRATAEYMIARFVLQSGGSWTSPSTAPTRMHPTTYMIATEEIEGAVAAQEASAANADHVVRLPGAHMLMLHRPDKVADALAGVSIC